MALDVGVERDCVAGEAEVADTLATSVPWVRPFTWFGTTDRLTQTEEDVDRGDDGADEGEDRDKEGEQGGGLLAISLTPLGEEEAAGLLLKPDAGVKSMGQERSGCRSQTAGPGGW